jgi:GDSL-like Lipase/Acylhydrolase family
MLSEILGQPWVDPATYGVLVAAGDSITLGLAGISQPQVYWQRAVVQLAIDGYYAAPQNQGIGGATSATLLSLYSADVAPLYKSKTLFRKGHTVPSILIYEDGANDFYTSVAESTTRANQVSYVAAARATGFKVLRMMCPPSTQAGTPAGYTASQLANNAFWRTQVGTGVDGVIDWVSDARFADGTTLFVQPGNVHPNAAGHLIIGRDWAAPAIEALVNAS